MLKLSDKLSEHQRPMEREEKIIVRKVLEEMNHPGTFLLISSRTFSSQFVSTENLFTISEELLVRICPPGGALKV